MEHTAEMEIMFRTKRKTYSIKQINYAEVNKYHDQIVREYKNNNTILINENQFYIEKLQVKIIINIKYYKVNIDCLLIT